MKRTNRKVTMPTACWNMLRNVIGQPGWATTDKLVVQSGGLALKMDEDDGVIKIAPPPKMLTPTTEKAWAEKSVTGELDSQEQNAIEKCLRFHIEKGAFGGNRYSKQLIEEFLDVS
jgi:hypothetical protein